MHGSWNHSRGVGFKVIRIPVVDGVPQPWDDFATGWFPGGRAPEDAWGRPVDVQTGFDGALYVTDDRAGAVYRIAYAGG
jgi:glucose/arabinose dehydrogenase